LRLKAADCSPIRDLIAGPGKDFQPDRIEL